MSNVFIGEKKQRKELTDATHNALMASLKCIENDAKSGTPSSIKTTSDLAPILHELTNLWRDLNIEWQLEAMEGVAEPNNK